eukprot:5756259-Amphidinium_carterae.1
MSAEELKQWGTAYIRLKLKRSDRPSSHLTLRACMLCGVYASQRKGLLRTRCQPYGTNTAWAVFEAAEGTSPATRQRAPSRWPWLQPWSKQPVCERRVYCVSPIC